jgi:hypothetical protein
LIEEVLEDLSWESPAVRPLENVHSIWEIGLHLTARMDAVRRRLSGIGPCPEENTESSQDSQQELKHELTVLTWWNVGLPGQAEFRASH